MCYRHKQVIGRMFEYTVTSECTALPDYISERVGGVSDVGFSSCAAQPIIESEYFRYRNRIAGS